MKERLFQIKKRILRFFALQRRKIGRTFINTTLSVSESFNVPIIINNRNRYTYLKDLVDWLVEAGYTNIVVLDNDSSYVPLLEYYKHTPARVIFLKKNSGYKALWSTEFYQTIKNKYYVYTDPDLLPSSACPKDLVYRLYLELKNYPVEKSGSALKIDDLPEHYEHKEKVIKNESPFWEKSPAKDVYFAPIDTTFALYKPLAYGDAEDCEALRVGGDLVFIHRPWYEDSRHPDEETKFYVAHSSNSSYWYKKVENTEK